MHELPPTVGLDLTRTSLRDYWLDRLAQHVLDFYAGLPLTKFPEDLRTYEHLIWLARPDLVIEIGTFGGGSGSGFATGCARLRRTDTSVAQRSYASTST